ncbi:MAG: HNH endonuclease [Alphaproteobacteria bacterium]|nr:HNH endonuclease [Alphaproteobacteria bacterium]
MIRIERPACPNPTALTTNYKHPQNKEALKKASYNKCMYCESHVSQIAFGDVEHIKPKDKFPALEFSWENHGYACSKCNNEKRNKFFDQTPFIDPYSENPREHIYAFGAMLRPKQGSERGEITINEIGLNRADLLEKRDKRINELETAIKACYRTQNEHLRECAMSALITEITEDKEYSMVVQALYEAHETE